MLHCTGVSVPTANETSSFSWGSTNAFLEIIAGSDERGRRDDASVQQVSHSYIAKATHLSQFGPLQSGGCNVPEASELSSCSCGSVKGFLTVMFSPRTAGRCTRAQAWLARARTLPAAAAR